MTERETPLWSGRFTRPPAPEAADLGRSLSFDVRLVPYDVEAGVAHVRALEDAGFMGRAVDPATGVFVGVMYGDYAPGANLAVRAKEISLLDILFAVEQAHEPPSRFDALVAACTFSFGARS